MSDDRRNREEWQDMLGLHEVSDVVDEEVSELLARTSALDEEIQEILSTIDVPDEEMQEILSTTDVVDEFLINGDDDGNAK